MRYDVVRYIYRFKTLPRGDEEILCKANGWGISYAFSPYLSYIFSALLLFLVSPLKLAEDQLFHIARLTSVFSSTVTVLFLYKISKALHFKNPYLLPCFVGLLPQFAFISAYVNNDAFALMSTSIIVYAWIIGLRSMWDRKSCICLTIGMALCVSSYYNCYGYLLASLLLFVVSHLCLCDQVKTRKSISTLLRKTCMIAVCVFILSGWWFLKNYYYFGDFMGRNASRQMAIKYAIPSLNPLNRQSLYKQGLSLAAMFFDLQWIKTSIKSFIGGFGYMTIFLPPTFYYLYTGVILTGLLGLSIRQNHRTAQKKIFGKCIVFHLSLMIAAAAAGIISMLYSYFMDFQPQGRYLLPAAIPLMLWVTYGWQKIAGRIRRIPISTILLFLIALFHISVLFFVLIPQYY